MLHSIATMVDVLRADPGSLGLVTGVGMHMTKHAFGVYSTAPPPSGLVEAPTTLPTQPAMAIADRHNGTATIASYTVAHGRDGAPAWGLVIADLRDGVRAYGRVEDADLLAAMEANEWVGQQIELRSTEAGVNLVQA